MPLRVVPARGSAAGSGRRASSPFLRRAHYAAGGRPTVRRALSGTQRRWAETGGVGRRRARLLGAEATEGRGVGRRRAEPDELWSSRPYVVKTKARLQSRRETAPLRPRPEDRGMSLAEAKERRLSDSLMDSTLPEWGDGLGDTRQGRAWAVADPPSDATLRALIEECSDPEELLNIYTTVRGSSGFPRAFFSLRTKFADHQGTLAVLGKLWALARKRDIARCWPSALEAFEAVAPHHAGEDTARLLRTMWDDVAPLKPEPGLWLKGCSSLSDAAAADVTRHIVANYDFADPHFNTLVILPYIRIVSRADRKGLEEIDRWFERRMARGGSIDHGLMMMMLDGAARQCALDYSDRWWAAFRKAGLRLDALLYLMRAKALLYCGCNELRPLRVEMVLAGVKPNHMTFVAEAQGLLFMLRQQRGQPQWHETHFHLFNLQRAAMAALHRVKIPKSTNKRLWQDMSLLQGALQAVIDFKEDVPPEKLICTYWDWHRPDLQPRWKGPALATTASAA